MSSCQIFVSIVGTVAIVKGCCKRKLDVPTNCLTNGQYETWLRAGLSRIVNAERGKLKEKLKDLIIKKTLAEDNGEGIVVQYR